MLAKLLISADLSSRGVEINRLLESSGLFVNHPDLLYFPYNSKLGIGEARKIKDHFAYKSFSGKIKAVVLEDASNLTVEAQNALLKTLEELPQDALFILGADSNSKLLPTIVSRCEIVILEEAKRPIESFNIEKLLKSSMDERFEYVEKLKDREEFLHQMASFFHQKLNEPDTHAESDSVNLKEFLQELLQAEEWAQHNVNIRAIVEYLMLVMPSKV